MKSVLEMGLHMCIYPEGTRNKTNQPLKEFKDGAFRLAIETQKPIIPAVLFNTKSVLPSNKAVYFWPSKIEMHFLPAVNVSGLEMNDAKALKDKVFDMMWKYIEERKKLFKEVG
jgi:1-acyl-sn-glycerol-3-phosphate acyltransferase